MLVVFAPIALAVDQQWRPATDTTQLSVAFSRTRIHWNVDGSGDMSELEVRWETGVDDRTPPLGEKLAPRRRPA